VGAEGGGHAPGRRGDKGHRTQDVDGIKVFHPAGGERGGGPDDWALVIPDVTEPVTHLWAEAGTLAAATALADQYEALVKRAFGGE